MARLGRDLLTRLWANALAKVAQLTFGRAIIQPLNFRLSDDRVMILGSGGGWAMGRPRLGLSLGIGFLSPDDNSQPQNSETPV